MMRSSAACAGHCSAELRGAAGQQGRGGAGLRGRRAAEGAGGVARLPTAGRQQAARVPPAAASCQALAEPPTRAAAEGGWGPAAAHLSSDVTSITRKGQPGYASWTWMRAWVSRRVALMTSPFCGAQWALVGKLRRQSLVLHKKCRPHLADGVAAQARGRQYPEEDRVRGAGWPLAARLALQAGAAGFEVAPPARLARWASADRSRGLQAAARRCRRGAPDRAAPPPRASSLWLAPVAGSGSCHAAALISQRTGLD
jgi:hypothetical protein